MPSPTYGKQHEADLRYQFVQEADSPMVAKWFLATPDAVTQQPGALSYFIGFRICEAYYAQARDKKQALRTIVGLHHADELLAYGRKYLAQ